MHSDDDAQFTTHTQPYRPGVSSSQCNETNWSIFCNIARKIQHWQRTMRPFFVATTKLPYKRKNALLLRRYILLKKNHILMNLYHFKKDFIVAQIKL